MQLRGTDCIFNQNNTIYPTITPTNRISIPHLLVRVSLVADGVLDTEDLIIGHNHTNPALDLTHS